MSLVELAIELEKHYVDRDVASVLMVSRRNELLAKSDWTQMPDTDMAPERRQEWKIYRQELRDLTNRSDFPFIRDEPVAPEQKIWTAERVRTEAEEEAMRLEREALESAAREAQAEYERSLSAAEVPEASISPTDPGE